MPGRPPSPVYIRQLGDNYFDNYFGHWSCCPQQGTDMALLLAVAASQLNDCLDSGQLIWWWTAGLPATTSPWKWKHAQNVLGNMCLHASYFLLDWQTKCQFHLAILTTHSPTKMISQLSFWELRLSQTGPKLAAFNRDLVLSAYFRFRDSLPGIASRPFG